jgi:adenylosuccinate synthase
MALLQAVRISSISYLAITKLDVLSGIETIKVATAYKSDGTIMENMPADLSMFPNIELVFDELPGWEENISDIREYEKLPENCKTYISYIEDKLGADAAIISVGPKREETILLKDMF